MIIYWGTLLAILFWYVYLILAISKKKVGPIFKFRKEWIKKKIVPVYIGGIFIILATTLAFYKPLGKTIWCAYKGHEHSVETRRDWISGVCSYQGPNHAWIPIERLLGFPDGDADKNSTGNTNTTN